MFEGCSSFSKRHEFANTRHFKQQVIVFEINMTLTTQNVLFGTKRFIYNLLQGVRLAPPRGRCNGGHIWIILSKIEVLRDVRDSKGP